MKIDGLLDTNIIVDILRTFPAALSWMQTNSALQLGIPSIVWMEVVQGANIGTDQRSALKLLSSFTLFLFESADNQWAMQQLERFHLSHNVGILDVMIAAIAVRNSIPLYTRNTKHFVVLPAVQLVVPY